MISIIVCSRTKSLSPELEANINETIGCSYEFVVIDNSTNSYSIFEAYSEGVKRATNDICCFMHDDIIFRSQGWGAMVVKAFEEVNTGLVGVVGAYSMTHTRIGWFNAKNKCGRVLQRLYERDGNYIIDDCNYGKPFGDVVTSVDGLFFCIRKSLFTGGPLYWDSETYKGFHCYDLDISMQINSIGYVCRIVDVAIEHISIGSLNDSFYDSVHLFHKKWDKMLPYAPESIASCIIADELNFDLDVRIELYRENEYKSYILRRAPIRWMRRLCECLKLVPKKNEDFFHNAGV